MQRTAVAALLTTFLLTLLVGGTVHLWSDDGIVWEPDKVFARFSKRPIPLSFDSETPFFLSEFSTTPFGLAATAAALFGVLFALFAVAGLQFTFHDDAPHDSGRPPS